VAATGLTSEPAFCERLTGAVKLPFLNERAQISKFGEAVAVCHAWFSLQKIHTAPEPSIASAVL
jgi:hypothetical protein